MDNLTLWLSLITTVVLAMFIMPSVIAMNQGKMVRNIAVWLAIFVMLGWVYKAFGPFDTVAEQRYGAKPPVAEQSEDNATDNGADNATDLGDNYSPPQE
jgi:hypothetical protein